VTLAFIAAYAAILVGRSLSLGEPLTIPLHRLESGAFLLFSFFMISDPKTTPEDPRERALFVALAALIAYILQFHFFISDGIFYAPFLLALIRFIALKPAANGYEWGDPPRVLSLLRRPRGPHPAE
jgi:Na+-translocating ferredoxin:NAD+ oxidoreductase RnfD subunit